MITTEEIARDFLASKEQFNRDTIIERYNLTPQKASDVLNNLIRLKKYDVDVRRNGNAIVSMRVIGVKGKDSAYLRIRQALEASGEAFAPSELVKKFGLRYHTAAHILFKLRKDPHINTETVQKGRALAVRIKTEPVSTEAKLWRALTTKRWSEIARLAA